MTAAAITIKDLNLWYGSFQALKLVNAAVQERQITAIIGPSGCGKSTLLRAVNRMNDLIEGVKTSGEIFVGSENIFSPESDLVALRKKVGMVFQRPNPFPLSIYENIAFGLRIHAAVKNGDLDSVVERSLTQVGLWDLLKDRLKASALGLSLEQRQRLCIARALAVEPQVLLMDEPCSALDPQSTANVEDLMRDLRDLYTIVIVTHNMQQAARVSDQTGFMLLGEMIEFGATRQIFETPADKRTEEYITGRYG